MKNGFTLVELSIVLIIIGMLVGGILVAQNLINSAAIASTISQIGKFDAGVGAFMSRYRQLPGDATAFGGNGDGLIARNGTAWASCTTYTRDQVNLIQCEMANFWNQIDPVSFPLTSLCTGMDYKYRNSFPKRIPLAKVGQKGSFFLATAAAGGNGYPYDAWCTDNINMRNYYVIVSPFNYPKYFNEPDNYGTLQNTFHSVQPGERTLTPSDMLAFDQKMDDGVPSAGHVIAGSFRAWNSGASDAPLATCSSGTRYLVEDSGYQCTPMFRMGVVSGNLK